MLRRCTELLLLSWAVTVLSGCASAPPAPEPAPVEAPIDPIAAVQQFDRAVTLMSAGDIDLAIRELKSLSESYPTYSGPLVNLGIAHMKSGQLKEAEQAFTTAIDRKSDNAAAYNQLGILYRHQGRFKDADLAYSKAIELAPDYPLAHLNLGVLCDLYLQQPERALAQYERYVALTDSPEPKVAAWIAEIRTRLGSARTARIDR